MPNTQQINWDSLTHYIINQKTILFVGPGVTVNYSEPDSEKRFFRTISKQYQKGISAFHEQDGLLIYKEDNFQAHCMKDIADFYGQNFTNPLLEKLAEMPFHLIINVSPDLSLNKVFKAKGFDFESHHFKTRPPQSIIENTPSREKPLIYNLLGCMENDSSLITSHGNMFGLIDQIYSNKDTLPLEIRLAFNTESTRSIIFLGFDFSKWYFQLILNLLGINYKPCIRYAFGKGSLHKHSKMLYESHFNIEFVDDEPETFINTLHSKFREEELRKQPLKRKHYKRNEILKLLNASFSAERFETFCSIEFEEFYDQHFTPGQTQESRIRALFEFVKVKNIFEEMLDKILEYNPVHFDKFGPYYEEK